MSLFLRATAFFSYYLFIGVFNLALTFSSVMVHLAEETLFDFLSCVKFRASTM